MAGFVAGVAFDYAKNQALGAYNSWNYNSPHGSGGGYGNVYNNDFFKGYEKGGIVTRTERALVHKNELIIPVKDVKKVTAAMKKAGIPLPAPKPERPIYHLPKDWKKGDAFPKQPTAKANPARKKN